MLSVAWSRAATTAGTHSIFTEYSKCGRVQFGIGSALFYRPHFTVVLSRAGLFYVLGHLQQLDCSSPKNTIFAFELQYLKIKEIKIRQYLCIFLAFIIEMQVIASCYIYDCLAFRRYFDSF